MAEMEENRRAVEAARRKYEQFVQKQDRKHWRMKSCLSVKPAKMKQRLEEKRQKLLKRCQGELLGEDPEKQAALQELKQGLDGQKDEFLPAYEQRFTLKATSLGLSIAGSVLAVVGAGVTAGVGVGVAAAVLTVEEAVAIGVGAGGFTLIAGTVSNWFGARFRRKANQNRTDTNAPGQGDQREGGDESSDQEPLLQGER